MTAELSTSIVVLDAATSAAVARERLQLLAGARWALIRRRGEWLALRAAVVAHGLAGADPATRLDRVLDLASQPPEPTFDLPTAAPPYPPGVALVGHEPVGYVADVHAMAVPRTPSSSVPSRPEAPRAADGTFAADAVVDAPGRVALGEVFELTVGVTVPGDEGDVVVTGLAPEVTRLEFHLHVVGAFEVVDRPPGPLVVDRATLAHQPVRFRLRASVPPYTTDPVTGAGVERVEVRFVHAGVPVGRVWREIEIGPATGDEPAPATGGSGISVAHQPQDLTIVIARPDADPSGGRYVLTLSSPHLGGPGRSWEMPLGGGDSPQALAARIRRFAEAEASTPQTDDTFLGVGRFIADRLPDGLWDALAEIAAARGPADDPLSALLVTDEAYVPWELAVLPQPLDAGRPPFLGAQLSVGRWPLDEPLPSPDPIIGHTVAVVVGRYGGASGYEQLPGSEAEAARLVDLLGARLVPASRGEVDGLLSGVAGPVDVVHFTGHGDADAAGPEGVALVLEDGELNEFALAAAAIAGERPVLLVFNACVAGFAHEAMGAFAGMAGAAARAGYRGYLAPIWAVVDDLATDIGVGLYREASRGTTVGEYLREVRGRFVETPRAAAHTTHLAYAFYGHPDFRIEVGVR